MCSTGCGVVTRGRGHSIQQGALLPQYDWECGPQHDREGGPQHDRDTPAVHPQMSHSCGSSK